LELEKGSGGTPSGRFFFPEQGYGDHPGAGEGNRTLVVSLGSCCSTIELHPQAQPLRKALLIGFALCRERRQGSRGIMAARQRLAA
jgi:hypothetical protein